MFKTSEILKATGGKLLAGSPDGVLAGVSLDSRTINKGEIFIAIRGENFDGHDFISKAIRKGAACIVSERAVQLPKTRPPVFVKVDNSQRALGDIASYHRRRFDLPFIAVTGSNGKTTAKDMIAWVLSARYRVLKNEGTKNNQIGLPLALLNLNRKHQAAVLEIGTNHPGEVGYLCGIYRPNIGIITNIGPSHLEHFGGLKSVFNEKISLVRNLAPPYLSILNRDDKFLSPLLDKNARVPFRLGFGFSGRSDFLASDVKEFSRGFEFAINGHKGMVLNTLARHNIYNALCAAAVARIMGMEYGEIALRLRGFDFPQGRFKPFRRNNVNFIDDTYNSNPLSLKAALEAFGGLACRGRKVFIMGDMLELGRKERDFHRQAGRDALRVSDVMIFTGRLSRFAAEAALRKKRRSGDIFVCRNSREARRVLFKKVIPDSRDIILVKGSRLMKMEYIFS
ncbi:MAG: UDP-N-acetylmuramoyl-tripeptide--D-alanyl-D-alanine ligase [Candidatus Omnitrophota bacterium]